MNDEAGKKLSSNRYIFTQSTNLAPLFAAKPTELEYSKEISGDVWKLNIRNIGQETAFFLWLEDSRDVHATGYVYSSDNHFCLFPAESKTIALSWSNVPPDERDIQIRAWNASL